MLIKDTKCTDKKINDLLSFFISLSSGVWLHLEKSTRFFIYKSFWDARAFAISVEDQNEKSSGKKTSGKKQALLNLWTIQTLKKLFVTTLTLWDFWQSNETELILLLLSRNFLVIKGGNAKNCVTAFSSYHVLSTRTLSCNREGVYLYEHFKITKRYKNYHFFSRN